MSTEESTASQDRVEVVKDVLTIKARSFIDQRYPLSSQGEILRQTAKLALEQRNDAALKQIEPSLPTVENPHLDMFQELKLAPGDIPTFFGPDLADVQVTKGCSHKCNFCSLAASHRVEVMPFAGVLKIAEAKRTFEEQVLVEWDSWVQAVKDQKGLDINPPLGHEHGMIVIPAVMFRDIPKDIGDLYASHPLSKILRPDLFFDRAPIGPFIPQYDRNPFVGKTGYLTSYYDSDPFDYVSTSMVHEDGSPTDYGDVCRVLVSEIRPIHITTAGWVRGNQVAERAARKIVELYNQNPAYFDHPRISVNKTERRAERSMNEYLEDMKATIAALKDIGPEVLLISDTGDASDEEFEEKVITPLREWLKTEGQPAWTEEHGGRVSHYSGRAAEEGQREGDFDNANCMPGYHIWPNGEITNQQYEPQVESSIHRIEKKVPKGGRPKPIGRNIFK